MAKILVIEDVAAVLLSIRIIVTGAGHEVVCAPDGHQGLSLLCGQKFDLVITDIWMPGLGGKDVIAQGRTLSPGTKFLAITGGNPNVAVSPAERGGDKIGADAVLYKPFEKAELLQAIAALLAGAPAHG
jgi:CheY-like chemotaxis protein